MYLRALFLALLLSSLSACATTTSSSGTTAETCAPTGTWTLTETRGAGTCDKTKMGDTSDTVSIANTGTLTWQIIGSDGKPDPTISCNGTIDNTSCKLHVTCSQTMADSSLSMTGVGTYDVQLGASGTGTGTAAYTVTVTPTGGTASNCDAQFTIAAQRK